MRVNVKVQGIDKVMNDFTQRGLAAQYRADKVTESYTRKMANEAGANAPVDTGDMRANILASPRRVTNAVWEFGGTLAYTRRQEYEHSTKRGFIRKAVWKNRNDYRSALKREVTKD